MKRFLLLLFISVGLTASAQKAFEFHSIDSLLAFAEKRSAVGKVSEQQSLLAKWTKITALGNTINLKSPFSAQWTSNTELPVSYLPGEIFGGPPGSFKGVQIGQQYVKSYNLTPQIDLINPGLWARVKSADINKQLTETNNRLAKKSLFESIAAAYYNIVSAQQQLIQLKQNQASADSVERIIKNKSDAGIAREQDWNNAKINSLLVKDKINQTEVGMEQNYNNLRILCDLNPEENIHIPEQTDGKVLVEHLKANSSNLLENQYNQQVALNESELKSTRLQTFSPTLSLLFNQSWQQNSNDGFFSANSFKFNSQYVGLKLTVPFPLDATRLSQNYTSKITYQISGINAQHAKIQSKVNQDQLDLDYEKAWSSYDTNRQIRELKQVNYQKSLNQYTEGLLSTDLLLTAFTDLVNAGISYSSSLATLHYSATKISIHNTIQ